MKNKILQYSIVLFVITFISATSITFMKNITEPTLTLRAKEKLDYAINNNLKILYPSMSDDYEVLDDTIRNKSLINNIFKITFKNNDNTYYTYNVSSPGKNGNINFLVVYNEMNKIDNIIYISHKETRGRGDKIESEDFLSKIVGQHIRDFNAPNITGATYSSLGIKNGIEEANKHLQEVILGE